MLTKIRNLRLFLEIIEYFKKFYYILTWVLNLLREICFY